MFENLITRITSPNLKRRYIYNCQSQNAIAMAEAHSEPEIDDEFVQHESSATRQKTTNRPSRDNIERRRVRGRKVMEPGLRQARSLGRLDGLREAEQLADYSKSMIGLQQPVVTNPRSRDLDRIQQLFPQDFLGLHETDPCDTLKYNCRKQLHISKSYTSLETLSKLQSRYFLMEAPCALGTPENPHSARPRHFFLFSDLLLIAKARNGLTYKLKEKIRISEMWLAPSPDLDIGFLLGWSGQNTPRTYLVVWATHAAKDLWWSALQNALLNRLPLEPSFTNVKVTWRDPKTNKDCVKIMSIGPELTVAALTKLVLPRSLGDSGTYTMYCRSPQETTPVALYGYERPHAIQLARIRKDVSTDEGFDLAHCISSPNASNAVIFELKQSYKTLPKNNKVPLKLFRKGNPPRLWGVPLSRLCAHGSLPPTILAILRGLVLRGPQTHGIFRRCANVRVVKELRERVDRSGVAMCEELLHTSALLLAALLKDFLRNLPEPLISGDIIQRVKPISKVERLRQFVVSLPKENNLLLAYIICVLYHIAKKSEHNQMNAKNLGVCVGPSVMWSANSIRESALVIENLINNCRQVFGPHVTSLLGESTPDSGAEESDSLHSLVDSVELNRDQISLSRDSGLTLSEDDRESPGLLCTTQVRSVNPYQLPPRNQRLYQHRNNNITSPITCVNYLHPESGSSNDLEIHRATLLNTSSQLSISTQNVYGFHRGDWWRQAVREQDLPSHPMYHKSSECLLVDESESYV